MGYLRTTGRFLLSLLIGIGLSILGILFATVMTAGLDYLNRVYPPHGGAFTGLVLMVGTITVIAYKALSPKRHQ
jgi:hypothetical protein